MFTITSNTIIVIMIILIIIITLIYRKAYKSIIEVSPLFLIKIKYPSLLDFNNRNVY